MRNESNISACPISESIANTTFFPLLLSLVALVGTLSVVPNLLLAWVVFRALVYPANLRYLLSHLSLNIIWASIGYTVKALYMLSVKTCDLSMSALRCRQMDLPSVAISSGNIFYSLMAICVERLYCSVRYRSYEKESTKPWLALAFLSIIWIGSLVANLYTLPTIPDDRYVPICEFTLAIGPEDAGKSLLSSIIMELIALLTILGVSFWDGRKLSHSAVNRAKFTLTERFQLSQCVQVNKMLVPSVILHGLCFLPFIIIMLLVVKGVNISMEYKWALFQFAYLYRQFYALIHPLLLFGRNKHMVQYLAKCCPQWMVGRLVKANQVANVQEPNQVAHFNVLENIWRPPNKEDKEKKQRV